MPAGNDKAGHHRQGSGYLRYSGPLRYSNAQAIMEGANRRWQRFLVLLIHNTLLDSPSISPSFRSRCCIVLVILDFTHPSPRVSGVRCPIVRLRTQEPNTSINKSIFDLTRHCVMTPTPHSGTRPKTSSSGLSSYVQPLLLLWGGSTLVGL
jgi:hypothetical protein